MRTITRDDIVLALTMTGDGSSDFDLNPGGPSVVSKKEAAVLVPIVGGAQGPELVLTKRSKTLKAHPGQISFPGGRVDETDADIPSAALREAWEETGLDPKTVTVMGTLPSHKTVTAFKMTPVVGWIDHPWDAVPNPGEVEEVFSVPLSHVLDIHRYSVQSRSWLGQDRHYFTVPFGPYYIWGATARILYGFAGRMAHATAS